MTSDARTVIDRCLSQGDEGAWEEFVRRFDSVLRRGVVSALNGRPRRGDGLEEDLLQEVYCRILERDARALRRCRERDGRAIRTFLARLARNAAIDHLRWRRTVKRGRGCLVSPTAAEHRLLQAPDGAPSAEERLMLRQRGRRFLAACRRVAGGRVVERNVRILALAFLGGLSSREIARSVGSSVSPGSVDSLVSRARKKLAAEGLPVITRRLSR